MKVLVTLASHAGQIVTREELRHEVWGDETFVDFEQGLSYCIRQIREVLGDDFHTPRYVETIPRCGYRFIGPTLDEPPLTRDSDRGAEVNRTAFRHRVWRVLMVASLLLGLIATVTYTWKLRSSRNVHRWPPLGSGVTRDRIESLAVLPLENLSRDPEQEYFADGMTDELITELAKIGSLKVISRTSVMQYKGARKAMPKIGQALNVDAVVEGTVQRSGQRVRISVQLIQAATDRHLWAESYDRDLSDVLGLQREVALSIAREISAKLTTQEAAYLASFPPVNSEAHDAYLMGRYFWNKRTRNGLLRAREFFNKAIGIDPRDALAYAGLADTYELMGSYEVLPNEEAVLKAKAAAMKALELNDNLAEAHACLGTIAVDFDWDWPTAEREFKRALELNPGYATAHQWYAEYLIPMGRFEEAAQELKRAQALDPFSIIINRNMGLPYFYARQFDVAMEQFQKTIEMDPNSSLGYFMLGWTQELKGQYAEAIVQLQKARRIDDSPLTVAHMAHVYATSGKKSEARKLLTELQARSKREYVSPVCMAVAYEGLGENDQALKGLEKGYQQHAYLMSGLRVDLRWVRLRSDPRFQSLLHRLNLDR